MLDSGIYNMVVANDNNRSEGGRPSSEEKIGVKLAFYYEIILEINCEIIIYFAKEELKKSGTMMNQTMYN